jgi:chromosome partitioning protein
MTATIIAIANQKGGVGKTTTAVNLSFALHQAGYPTAVLDFDPQAHATKSLGVDTPSAVASIYDVLMEPDHYPMDAALVQSVYGPWCIPASIHLAKAEMQLVQSLRREMLLRKRLATLSAGLRYILIDCPPSLGLLTVNALVAADAVIVPLQCELLALEGLRDLLNTIRDVSADLNPDLTLQGILLTMFNRRAATCRKVTSTIRETFGARVFNQPIPRYEELVKMLDNGPVGHYHPGHPAAADYSAVAQEVIADAQAE